MESKLFTPVTFGPLTLRNRTIRSAAFEKYVSRKRPFGHVARLSPFGCGRRHQYDYCGLCGCYSERAFF